MSLYLFLFSGTIISFILLFFYPNQIIILAIFPVTLFGASFYLDGKETLKHGKEIIMKYERSIILKNLTKFFGVEKAMFFQALIEGAVLGWIMPFLFQDFYWHLTAVGACVFVAYIHLTGYVHNRHLLTNEPKRNIFIKLFFDKNVTLSLKQ